jgi:dTDP-4-amino-4,6-dideoxygalactose transaminase
VAKTIRMLREHGQARKYYHDLEGYNGRLDAIQAAFLRVKLRHLDAWNDLRRVAALRYGELLSGLDGVVPPFESERNRSVHHLYVVRHDNRHWLSEHLNAQGISTGLHYPLPVHLQNCYTDWGYRAGSLPISERTAAEILSLPMFPGLTASAQQRVASALADAVSSRCSTATMVPSR